MSELLTKEEISWYLKHNCTLENSPRCSECNTQNDDIYTDELDGEMFCKNCLMDSLNNDEYALKELRNCINIEKLEKSE